MKKRLALSVAVLVVVVAVAAVFWWRRASQPPSVENEEVIASIIPLTGPAAEFGGYNREAADLFVEDYNSAHKGLRQLRHVFQDSKSSPKDGVNAAQSIFLGEHPFSMQVQLRGCRKITFTFYRFCAMLSV